jgi:hypothetical protein
MKEIFVGVAETLDPAGTPYRIYLLWPILALYGRQIYGSDTDTGFTQSFVLSDCA